MMQNQNPLQPTIRNRKAVTVEGKRYWINELTIGNIFDLYHSVEDDITTKGGFELLFVNIIRDDSLIGLITNCPSSLFLKTTPTKLKLIYEIFLEVNDNLFKPNRVVPEPKEAQSNESFIFNLFDFQCILVEAGHVNVLGYGYSYFIKAINNHEKNKSNRLAELASGFRHAHHSDNKEWKSYMRSLIG